MSWLARTFFLAAVVVSALVPPVRGADAEGAFDAANKLYEQGRFADAAAAYAKQVEAAPGSPALYFNLGNAWFKAGQIGRAIAAYREAAQLAPRDPNVQFNLQFARKKVSGTEAAHGSLFSRALSALSVNEWTMLAAMAFWAWMLLLAVREWRPAWRGAVGGYTATAGVVTVVLAGCVAGAASQQNRAEAVVSVAEAIVRSGPLEEAKVLHQLRDGVELEVIDRKDLVVGEQKQSWVQVRDAAGRTGWLKSDQVAQLRTARGGKPGP